MAKTWAAAVAAAAAAAAAGAAVVVAAAAEAATTSSRRPPPPSHNNASCPCSNATLCDPITRSGPENVFAFHTTGADNWREYDWSIITTVCVFGDIDPELLCHAHANDARVTFGSGGLDVPQWRNETAVEEWVATTLERTTSTFADLSLIHI